MGKSSDLKSFVQGACILLVEKGHDVDSSGHWTSKAVRGQHGQTPFSDGATLVKPCWKARVKELRIVIGQPRSLADQSVVRCGSDCQVS